MNLMRSHDLLLTSTLLLLLLLLLTLSPLPTSCLQLLPLTSSPQVQGMRMEDKVRLGSTPPNCHNRCHECSPCAAVQVPAMPNPRVVGRSTSGPMEYGQHNNYKPLGWKCRCSDRFYNP